MLDPRISWRAAGLLLALSVGGCVTPSRRLPARMVDDPITLPHRMLEVSVRGSTRDRGDLGEQESALMPSFRYGLTERLTLDALTVLTFALLDDAPVEHASTGARAAAAPISLAVSGGLLELGYATSAGLIASPILAVSAHKRLDPRLRVRGQTSGGTRFTGSRGGSTDGWWLAARAGVLFQASHRAAVDVDFHGGWGFDGWLSPIHRPSGLTSHWFGATPGGSYRLAHWLTLGLQLDVRVLRWRPVRLPAAPDTPVPPPGVPDWSPPATVGALATGRFTF